MTLSIMEALKTAERLLVRVEHAQSKRVGRPLYVQELQWVLAAVMREHGVAQGLAWRVAGKAVRKYRVQAPGGVRSTHGTTP